MNKILQLLYEALLIPLFVIFGLFIFGSELSGFVGESNSFTIAFTIIVGGLALGYYYYRMVRKYRKGSQNKDTKPAESKTEEKPDQK